MKRIICATTMLICLGLLNACGGSQVNTSEENNVTKEQSDVTEKSTEDSSEEADTQSDSEETTDLSIMGQITNDNEYVNEVVGLGIAFDDNWVIADDDTLAQLNGMIIDECTDEDLANQIENSGVVTVIYALRAADNANVNMNIQNMNIIYDMMLDEDEIIDASINQLPDYYASYGFEDVTMEKDSTIFAGEKHPCIKVNGISNGVEFCEMLVCYKQDNYVANCTAYASDFDTCKEILRMFYKVNN